MPSHTFNIRNAEFDRSGSQMPPGLTESRCPHISRYDFNHIFFDLAIDCENDKHLLL